jgi:hypothetical protein
MRAMNPRLYATLALGLPLAWAIGCATSGEGDLSDSGSDTAMGQPDAHFADNFSPPPDSGSGVDMVVPPIESGTPDAPTDVIIIPPTDGGKDTGSDTGGMDVGTDAAVVCKDIGKLCSVVGDLCTNPFYECYQAFTDGTTLDGGEVVDGGNDGVCLPPIAFPTACNDGTHHCAAGLMCLKASQTCLKNATEVACVCGNPATASACGPP